VTTSKTKLKINSGEFDARNDGAKPIDNRRAASHGLPRSRTFARNDGLSLITALR
jgi:hypothetical protein